MEQGRAEQGHQAHSTLDARPRRGCPPWPTIGQGVPDAGQRLRHRGRLRRRPDLRPGRRTGLRTSSPRALRVIGVADFLSLTTTAFQLAGFRHVVGTLGAIDDETAVRVAGYFYATLSDPATGRIDASRASLQRGAAARGAAWSSSRISKYGLLLENFEIRQLTDVLRCNFHENIYCAQLGEALELSCGRGK